MRNNILILAFSLVGGTALVSCGSGDGVSGSFQMGTLAVLGAKSLATQKYSPLTTANAEVIKSSTNYSYAHVDGLKLTVKQVRGGDATSTNPLTTAEINQEVELQGSVDGTVALNQDITWAIGSYKSIDILVENNWKIKAHCKTNYTSGNGNYTLVYTTASGVATQSCNTGSTCTIPTTYDYYSYTWLDDYYTQQGDTEKWITTNYSFSIAEGDTPKVSLFYDSTNAIVCWDGQDRTDGDFGYFNSMDSTRAATLWPDNTGAFAIISPASFPLLAYMSTDSTEVAPKGRTFLTAASNSTLSSGLEAGLENTYTVTMLFNAAGTPVSGNTRPFPGTSSSIPLNGDLEGFTANGSGWDFFDSTMRWDGTATPGSFVRNRKFVAWTLPGTQYSVFSSSVEDGPDCGQTLLDFQNNDSSRDCIGGAGTQTYYWKEVER